MAGRLAVGLDIGTSGVRAAEVAFGKDGVTLRKFGQVALPPEAVRDGEVADPEAVATAIRELWQRTKISGKKVIVGVANPKVIVRQIELPWLPASELKSSLSFQAQDYVPMPVEEAVLDFHTLEEFEGPGGRTVRGMLVAAARDMVNSLVDAVRKAGLTPTSVDLTSFAVLRSIGTVDELGVESNVEALVDVGARVTNIVVHENGIPRFVRILLMGGQDITDAISERVGLPNAEAEALKQQLSFAAGSTDPVVAAAARAAEFSVSSFVDEIRGSLDYYASSQPGAGISRLILTGGASRMAGLTARLSAVTRLPVHAGSAIAPLQIGKTGLEPEQLSYLEPLSTVPVGLALGAAS